jgi:hypothetical protein
LRYPGNWDPEPGAWRRYAARFKQETAMGLDVRPVALKELAPRSVPIAHLTGTGPQIFTAEEQEALKAYVQSGGVLVVDACGGNNTFLDAVRLAVEPLFPNDLWQAMPRAHPLLNAGPPGMQDLSVPLLRASTLDRRNTGNTYNVLRSGSGCILLAPIDMTCGLLGVTAADVRGYTPAYARALVKNTIFWALDGQVD